MEKIVAHIDMNSYFASVEQQDHPQWRGKPLGVCEHLGGIIIGASIEAKKWGIKTGTPVWEAKKLYPKIVLTRTSPDRYRHYHRVFVRLVSEYASEVEAYSIDEVFIDLTRACNIRKVVSGDWVKIDPWAEAARVIQEIKRRMKREVGDWLSVSAGVAGNKLLAKIGSDLQKPDGLVMIREKNVDETLAGVLQFTRQQLYEKLKLTDIPGIGRRMQKRLADLGIFTLQDLHKYPESRLVAIFGIMGRHIFRMGQLGDHPGLDRFSGTEGRKLAAEADAPGALGSFVKQDEEIKSMGHMYTLPKAYREEKYFLPVLYKLCEMVAARLRRKQLSGSVLHFHLHTQDHECFGKSKRLGYFTQDGREIFLQCRQVFHSCFTDKARNKNFVLIGVTVSGLAASLNQLSLFEKDRKQSSVPGALDKINAKYGDFTIGRVPAWLAREVIRDSLGFGRVKEL